MKMVIVVLFDGKSIILDKTSFFSRQRWQHQTRTRRRQQTIDFGSVVEFGYGF